MWFTMACQPGGLLTTTMNAEINVAINAACQPGGAVSNAINVAINAACQPGGAMHNLSSVTSHNAVARSCNVLNVNFGEGKFVQLWSAVNTVPPGFPVNLEALEGLTSAQLNALLVAYRQPVPATAAARKAAFMSFIGL